MVAPAKPAGATTVKVPVVFRKFIEVAFGTESSRLKVSAPKARKSNTAPVGSPSGLFGTAVNLKSAWTGVEKIIAA